MYPDSNMKQTTCPSGTGAMPSCGQLAVSYVPMQPAGSERYTQAEALSNGTLFPVLNLPFHLKVKATNVVDSALSQLQALQFVILELGLYLDTHPEDQEAFALFQKYVDLERKARQSYTAQFGPLCMTEAANDGTYTWPNSPWPWNHADEGGK